MLPPRSRLRYAALAVLCVVLGLATRPLKAVSDGLGSALGDALWAALVFLLLVIAFPRLPGVRAAIIAVAIAWGVELSQIYRAPGLDEFRRTTPGALTIGGTFSWGDLLCYAVGVVAIFLLDRYLRGKSAVMASSEQAPPVS